jgi:hypothetical protein
VVQPWSLAAGVVTVQRVFSGHVNPSAQGVYSQPCASAREELALHRVPVGQV